jgi:hypothetical protein
MEQILTLEMEQGALSFASNCYSLNTKHLLKKKTVVKAYAPFYLFGPVSSTEFGC